MYVKGDYIIPSVSASKKFNYGFKYQHATFLDIEQTKQTEIRDKIIRLVKVKEIKDPNNGSETK